MDGNPRQLYRDRPTFISLLEFVEEGAAHESILQLSPLHLAAFLDAVGSSAVTNWQACNEELYNISCPHFPSAHFLLANLKRYNDVPVSIREIFLLISNHCTETLRRLSQGRVPPPPPPPLPPQVEGSDPIWLQTGSRYPGGPYGARDHFILSSKEKRKELRPPSLLSAPSSIMSSLPLGRQAV